MIIQAKQSVQALSGNGPGILVEHGGQDISASTSSVAIVALAGSPVTTALVAYHCRERRAARLARPKTPRTWRAKGPRLNIFAQHEMLMVTFRRPQPPAEDIPIYNGRGCTLLELSQGKCRWPISNPGAQDFCFCGNEPVKGLPYCPGHARIAYRSVGRQRSRAGV